MRNHAFQPLEPRRLFSTDMAMYTYAGDLNLDGLVNGDEYGLIDNYIQLPVTSGYISGDFNYDGVVNGDDLGLGSPVTTNDFSGSAKRDVIVVSAPGSGGGVNVSINGKTTTTFASKLKISGNAGDDKIHIDLGDAYANVLVTIYGGDGDDVIVGGSCAERIIAGEGSDYIVGNGGRDTVYAEGGDDSVRGGGSSDLLDGGAGDDTIRGDGGNDRMSGGDGFDRMRGSTGNDTLNGGASKDVIAGELGNDVLAGDGGGDVLCGGQDNDAIDGGAGSDYCTGDGGADTLAGGSGADELFGGVGKDKCEAWDDLFEHKDLDGEDTGTATGGGSGGGSSSGVYNGVQGEVQRAYNWGAWDQPGLMTSMPAVGIQPWTIIGVATGEQVMGVSSGQTAVFAGQTITGATTLAMYTYAGDANLDGVIDTSDYGLIDFSNATGGNGYTNGDFNYDGVIDAGDYGIIDVNAANQG